MKTSNIILLGSLLVCAPAFAKNMQSSAADILRIEQPSYYEKSNRGDHYSIRDVKDARQQAKIGDLESQFNLGVILEARDRSKEAALWYEKAAERGHAVAQYNLAVLYFNGDGVRRNMGRASELLTTSAEKGNMDAQFLLGRMYFSGQGVTRDLKKEADLYRQASVQGHTLAQYNLGVLYYLGEGVKQDKIESYALWSNAHDQGLDTSEAIEVLEQELTKDQIDEALSRTRHLYSER